ncbi:HPP family protein [Methylobacterium sp. C1]|uniref:HPP family protein n=1 Tax=Methylobacterium sp. C1 TaxID=1479019 RepID=UPI000B319CC5|nr:HPP family protein [Methylobacterium sp. C1]
MTDQKGSTVGTGRVFGFRIFRPILAGATLRERLVACLGALIGIALTGLVCGWAFGEGVHIPLIVAPMGASAVLLFAVPASPLAQPWSVIGGNTISAFMGVIAARFVPDPIVAIGVGVALAIAAMSVTRSLHPPGGAAALTALIGGHAATSAGFLFPLFPVCVNSVILVTLGVAFHKLSGRSYPHAPVERPVNDHGTSDLPAALRVGFRDEDVDAALTAMNETLDIDRTDLDRLLRQVELQALVHAHRGLACEDVMSRDVVTIAEGATIEQATAVLLDRNIRTLPVVDGEGRLLGTVGLRELAKRGASRVADAVVGAKTAGRNDPAVGLVGTLTDGRTHAIVVVSVDRLILGVITQTDLLATLARQATLRAIGRNPGPAAA